MGTLSAPFWCLCQKLSLSPLYFNKTLLHKSSEQSSLVSGPGLNSPPGAKNPSVFAWFNNNLSVIRCACSKSLQSSPTLCNPMDCSSPGHSVNGILQARVLKWVAIFSSRGSSWPRDWTGCLLYWQAGTLPLVPPRKLVIETVPK